MERRGSWGTVLFMCCDAEHAASVGGFYAATKAGLRQMAVGLRAEARAKGVPLRVGCITPTAVAEAGEDGKSLPGMLQPADVVQVRVHVCVRARAAWGQGLVRECCLGARSCGCTRTSTHG